MYEPTLNPAWHFNSITLQVEHCQINEGESPIEATTCTCGCCPSSCMSWLFNLTSITQFHCFNCQRQGSTWHLHSRRTLSCICVPVLLQHDLDGHVEEQIQCRLTVKLLKAVRISPSHTTRKHNWHRCDSSETCVTDPNQKRDASATRRSGDKRSRSNQSSQPDCTLKSQSGMFLWVSPLRIRTPKVSSACFFNKATQKQTWNVVCWTSGMELLTPL